MIGMRRLPAIGLGLALCLGLPGCVDPSDDELTVSGSYVGTTSSECQLALRDAGTWKLVEAHAVAATFRENFAVEAKEARYYVEIHCADGKQGTSPEFDFRPPRGRVDLQPLELN